MAAVAPFIPLITGGLSLAGSFLGGSDAPDAPAPVAASEPPPPPAAGKTVNPDQVIREEAERLRGQQRRRTKSTPSLTELQNNKSSGKTLLGD